MAVHRAFSAADDDRSVSEPRVDVVATDDGVRLAVEVVGPDQPAASVVLAHGWTLTRSSWRPVVDRIRRRRPDVGVVTYDQRDHGDSRRVRADVVRRPASLGRLADDLAAVVAATAPDGPLVLGGHSMGGMTVLSLAGRHPELVADRVCGVLLVNTAAGGLRARPATAAAMRLLAAAPPVLRVPRVPAPLARRYGYGPDAPHDVIAQVRHGVRAPTARSVGTWYRALMELDERASVRHLADVPVSVLGGEVDRLTPAEHTRELATELPHATVDVVPKTGHMLPFEAPDVVAARLLALLPPSRGT